MPDPKRPSSSSEALRRLKQRTSPDVGDPTPPPRYEMLGELGRGGVGVVYRGRDVDLSREVAMKVLHPEFADNPQVLDRFVEEAQIGGQLQHPGIVPVYEVGVQADDRPFFAMKLVKGVTLWQLLSKRATLEEGRQQHVAAFLQVCQTMAYAHARRVVHRDLKPENVMVGSFGEVQVVDWGFAKVLPQEGEAEARGPAAADDTNEPPASVIETVRSQSDDDGSKSMLGSVLGTPAYMPREQALGDVEHMDLRSDVFGLGGILCEILTGAPPYRGKGQEALLQAARADLQDAWQRLDECGANAALIELCKRCLQKEPEHRPDSAQQVADEVAAYLTSVEQRARDAEVKAAEARVRARATLMLAAAALLIVLLGGGGWWYLREAAAERTRRADAKVADARADAGLALGQARSAGVDAAAAWQRAVDAGAQLRTLLDVDVSEVERQQATTLLTKVEQEAATADAERERNRRDRAMLDALADVYFSRPGERKSVLDVQRERDATYRRLFADYLDQRAIDADSVDAATARIRESRISVELATSLDDWAYSRTEVERAEHPDVGRGSSHLRQIARAVDGEDPLRNRVRDMLADDRYDAEALRELYADADLRSWSITAILLLEHALWQGRAPDEAVTLLERAVDAHPTSYALHARLAARFGDLPAPRHDLAMRAAGTARALRPDADLSPQIAYALMEMGRDDEALRYCERGLADRPDASGLLNVKGLLHMRLQQFDAATACFDRALEQISDDPAVLTNLGNCWRSRGDLAEAARCYERALAIDPDYVNCLGNFAAILDDLGRADEGLAMARRALQLDPLHAHAHEIVGTALTARQDYPAASASFRRAIELDPGLLSARNNYAMLLRRLGRNDDALAQYRAALAIEPENPLVHANIVRLLAQSGRPQEGLDHLATVDAAVRAAVAVRLAHALCEMALQRPDDAVATLQEAARAFPDVAEVHMELGQVYGSLNRPKDSLRHLLRASELGPPSASLHSNLSVTYRVLGDPAKSLEHAEAAVEADPTYGPSQFNLGIAFAQRMQLDGAIEHVAAAREIWANDPTPFGRQWYGRASQQLAAFLTSRREHERAHQVLRESVEHQPDNVDLRAGLANHLNSQDQDLAALREYLRVVELAPDHAPSWMNIANLRRLGGKTLRAQQAAYRAQELFAADDSSFARMWGGRARRMAEQLQADLDASREHMPIARGEQAADTAEEAIAAAQAARALDEHAVATTAWQRVFDTWPDRQAEPKLLVAAASSAALASTAQDVSPDERSDRRARAHAWLRVEVDRLIAADADQDEAREVLRRQLSDLRLDPDLDAVRAPSMIERMPVEQAAAWRRLWADVEARREALGS